MPHTFDTALAIPQRTVIRRGAIALLEGLLRANGGYLASVVPFGGVVRSNTDADNFASGLDQLEKAFGGRLPGVALALADRTGEPAGIGGFKGKGEIELLAYFATSHAADPVKGRHELDDRAIASDLADPGLDVMLEHVEELLVGQRCGASETVKQIRFDREVELMSRPEITLWQQTYQITVTRPINQHRNVSQLLESISTRVALEDTEVVQPLEKTKPSTIDTVRDIAP